MFGWIAKSPDLRGFYEARNSENSGRTAAGRLFSHFGFGVVEPAPRASSSEGGLSVRSALGGRGGDGFLRGLNLCLLEPGAVLLHVEVEVALEEIDDHLIAGLD